MKTGAMSRPFLLLTAALSAITFGGVLLAPGARAPLPAPRASLAAEPARDVYYAGCNEVRAAGKAPLYAGQPGYREDMDGDLDGIACEPRRF